MGKTVPNPRWGIFGLVYAGKVLMIGIVLGQNYRAMTASPNRDAAGSGTLLVVTHPGHWARTPSRGL